MCSHGGLYLRLPEPLIIFALRLPTSRDVSHLFKPIPPAGGLAPRATSPAPNPPADEHGPTRFADAELKTVLVYARQ